MLPQHGTDLLGQALEHTRSALAAVIAELEQVTADRWPGSLARVRKLAGIARDAATIAADTLQEVAGPQLPARRPPRRHDRPGTEPG